MYSDRPPKLLKRLLKDVIWDIPDKNKVLYLTFDDGPNPVITPWVINLLKQYKASATFFCVGSNVEKYKEVYDLVLADDHVVGNHTYSHKNGWKTRREKYLADVDKCSKVFSAKLFRPPYGKLRKSHYKRLKEDYQIVMWDVLSGDFDRKISNEKCLSNVLDNARGGSVIVFHDSEKALKKLYYTLPKVLEHFSKLGYTFRAIPVN
ncbi:MAG: polysaccharide deacetylase family protein [Flavobacteriales bacterium]|nr:polysaccharide deacetylase family protein [Flavobacteriales bacterium]